MIWRQLVCSNCGVTDDYPLPGSACDFDARTFTGIHRDLDKAVLCDGALSVVKGAPTPIGVLHSNEEALNASHGLRPGQPGYVKGGTMERTLAERGLVTLSEADSRRHEEAVATQTREVSKVKEEAQRERSLAPAEQYVQQQRVHEIENRMAKYGSDVAAQMARAAVATPEEPAALFPNSELGGFSGGPQGSQTPWSGLRNPGHLPTILQGMREGSERAETYRESWLPLTPNTSVV